MRQSSNRAIDALGFLTIVSYGSWFYGFGVIIQDIADTVGVGVGVLGTLYGATTLVGGLAAVWVGQILDRRGPGTILSFIGPAAAALYAISAELTNPVVFCCLFAVSGGLIAATGFYSFTQPLAIRLHSDSSVKVITRLTIWGAFSSPLMIPMTELSRDHLGWQRTIQISAATLVVSYVLCAVVTHGAAPTERYGASDLRSVLSSAVRSRFLRTYSLSGFLFSVSISSLLVFQVPVMKWAGVSAATAAVFAGARGLFQLLGRVPLVAFVERFGAWNVQFACRSLITVGACALWLSDSFVGIAAYVVVVGAGTGALSAVDGMVAREVLPPANLATMIALLGLVGTLGGASGPILVGLLVEETGSLGVVPFVVIVGTTSSVVVHQLSRRWRPPASPTT